MSGYQLAQINIARFRLPKQHEANSDFMNALDHVNAKAEASAGFVWRLVGEGNDATDVDMGADDPHLIVNMSVWIDVEALADFTYRQADHLAIMRRRREWFDHMGVYQALWWIPTGHRPTVEEGMAKVRLIADQGPTAEAFTFRDVFAAPDGTPATPVLDECA
jgi:Domain of unknown function (DUF3291)